MPFHSMKHYFRQIFFCEQTAHQFALTCALAVYVALSPFIGLHTVMLIGLGWLFDLNVPLLVGLGYAINNPFTMFPLIIGTYYFGYWLLHGIMGISFTQTAPLWMAGINNFLLTHTGLSEISFWAFMFGANILGIVLGILSYPCAKLFFRWWKKDKNKSHHNH